MKKLLFSLYLMIVLASVGIALTVYIEGYNLPNYIYSVAYIICGTSPLVVYLIKRRSGKFIQDADKSSYNFMHNITKEKE